jgi:hypothetical protein
MDLHRRTRPFPQPGRAGMWALSLLLIIVGCSKDDEPETPAQDEIAPGAVTDLALSALGDSAIVLNWTAPGDDDTSGTAASYDLRHAATIITEASWDEAVMVTGAPAPQAAGSLEEFTVPGLPPDGSRFFALRAIDEADNRAELSNIAALDRDPPVAIGDLRAGTVTPYAITLEWTAPADNGLTGMAAAYDLRYSETLITEATWDSAGTATAPSPLPAGTSQSAQITGLHPATQYYFAIRATDDSGNQTALSNVLDQATDLEGTWWDGFAAQGMNESIRALHGSYAAGLVAGGVFTSAGGENASRVALWSGTAWGPLAFGFRGLFETAMVRALAVYDDDLIAAGYFTNSGGTAVSNIARWDGVKWSPLRGGTDGIVMALTVYDGDLIAGGAFFTVDLMDIWGIARWDGAAWHSMGWSTSGVNAVSALGVYDGKLAVGGRFTQAGSVSADNVAQWNGQEWSPLGEGLTGGTSPLVSALAVYGDELIVAGAFSRSGETELANIARWNGNAWSPLGAGLGEAGSEDGVYGLAVHNGRLIAVGRFSAAGEVEVNNIAAWDGSSWSPLGSGVDGSALAVTVREGHLFVGGDFQNAGGQPSPYIARWDE